VCALTENSKELPLLFVSDEFMLLLRRLKNVNVTMKCRFIASSLNHARSYCEQLKRTPVGTYYFSLCSSSPRADSSSLDSQFDQKSINELNEHLYDSYDTLPNVKLKVDVASENNNKNLLNNKRAAKYVDDNVLKPKHLILCISNENLPFIDAVDSPGRYHNERVIQMMPHNLARPSTSDHRDWERLHEMQQNTPTHKYIEIDVMDSQICQKCHRVLSFKKTYKCSLCDYTCHQQCADKVSEEVLIKRRLTIN
jgi:hypothetical protein